MAALDVSSLDFEGLIRHEWLATNRLGGFASSTVCAMNTRKYHGLLVAAMAPPVGRMVLLSGVEETVITEKGAISLSVHEYPGTIYPRGFQHLRAFNSDPCPRWAYQHEGFTLEKTLQFLPDQNTVCIAYTLLGGTSPVDLELRPLLALRPIHELMFQWNGPLHVESGSGNGAAPDASGRFWVPATSRTPEVYFAHDGEFSRETVWYLNTIYRREQERGYAGLEDLWMPGVVRATVLPGHSVRLICSTAPIDLKSVAPVIASPSAPERLSSNGHPPDTTLDFLMTSTNVFIGRGKIAHLAQSCVIQSEYPWSSPLVRHGLIGLTGLLLVPCRYDEAKSFLSAIAAVVVDGVAPSEVPEDPNQPLVYRGADVALWLVEAMEAYRVYSGDESAIKKFLPTAQSIIANFSRGTRLGIKVEADGLLCSREPSVATTWMDAKAGDWVITPRHGCAVEINALWFNALRIVQSWFESIGEVAEAGDLEMRARKLQVSFNERFWNVRERFLYDVVDTGGNDESMRPNQLLAISLRNPVLNADRFVTVVERVINDLLTSRGLRTLAASDPGYQGRCEGNLVQRDRSRHQGTIHPWLVGPLVTAVCKAEKQSGRRVADVRQICAPMLEYLRGDGLGQLPGLFNGDAPHAAAGSIASAVSVGELTRCWAEDILEIVPQGTEKLQNVGRVSKISSDLGN